MLFYVLIVLVLCFLVFLRNNSAYWQKRNVKQVQGLIWKFVRGKRPIPEIYKEIYDTYPNDLHVGMFLGSKPALLLRDLTNIQTVFTGESQSFHSRGIVQNPKEVLADNLLFIDNFKRWKLIRQKISPIFTSSKLKNMFYIMNRCAKDFVETVSKNTKYLDDPFKGIYAYTTASLAASAIGIDTQNSMDSPFLEMSWKITEPSFTTRIKFVIINTFVTLANFLDIRIFGEHEIFFVGAMKHVLEERRRNQERRHDFIDTCLDLQKQGKMRDTITGYELEPTDELMASQAFFFFLAGADTSANTMHFTLIELANNPDILRKLHDEIDKVFNGSDELTYNDVEKFQYLEMVINEAIRKYPPIGSFQRLCSKDTFLPSGNVKVEKGTVVIIPVFGLHRDEKYFPNPELFDPERFSPDNIGNIPKYAYLPFSEGNRICIGMRFARLQVKAGLAWLLKRYTLRPETIIVDRFEFSLFGLKVPRVRYDLIPRC